jgi:hypothetical protein
MKVNGEAVAVFAYLSRTVTVIVLVRPGLNPSNGMDWVVP